MLRQFLDHYSTCSAIHEIRVVWSDQVNAAPLDWAKRYPVNKVAFEVHPANSLNNRFKPLTPTPTEGVLSIDDDLIVPCGTLHTAFQVWQANKMALVGFSPRMNAFDAYSGRSRYLRWQHTWWSGLYSIMLTKVAFLHRDYLDAYFDVIPSEFLQYVDRHRNCEDLAMAYTVAVTSGVPPVWVGASVHETSTAGISSGKDHFVARGQCLDELSKLSSSSTNLDIGLPLEHTVGSEDGGATAHETSTSTAELPPMVSSSRSVWRTGYQKCVYIELRDFFTLYWDPK